MGKILVIGGPSGSGKSTIAKHLGFKQLLSVTTRPPRPGEFHGVDYNFISDIEFDALEQTNQLVEKVEYAGYRYGITFDEAVKALESDETFYAILDGYGTQQFREFFEDDIIAVFIKADKEELIRRMKERGDTEEAIQTRIEKMEEEFSPQYMALFDYIIENQYGELHKAIEKIKKILNNTSRES